MKFGFSVIVDVETQDGLQLIAGALDGLPVEQVRSIVLSPARPLQDTPPATGYTADLVLIQPVIVGEPVHGFIYNDSATHGNHPFRDGTHIYTSRVLSHYDNLLVTENSTYRVIQEPTDGKAATSN